MLRFEINWTILSGSIWNRGDLLNSLSDSEIENLFESVLVNDALAESHGVHILQTTSIHKIRF